MLAYLFYISLGIALYANVCFAERLHEQIYSSIEGGAACFRRLNGTHQAGCTSSDKGGVGVVQFIRSIEDAEWIINNGTAGPYVAVVDTNLFHDAALLLVDRPDNLAGILVYDNGTARAPDFTQESSCPNEYYSGPGSQCSSSEKLSTVWNEHGTGLIRRDIPFPIFFIPKAQVSEVDKIEKCYQRYNLDKANQAGKPLCSLQLHSFMFAAVNTEVCMRRSASSAYLTSTKMCDPLGDHNVLYSLFPRNKLNNGSATLVTARIDTTSLFDGLAPGAAGSVVGMVTMITAASLLAKMIPITDTQVSTHNIIWTLLNGESFDYIGSQRLAYDLSRGVWPPDAPLNASQIRLHVELGQLGGLLLPNKDDTSWPFHGFAPYTSPVPSEITEFIALFSDSLNLHNMSVTPKFTMNLPPSSLHSFRRILPNETESGALPELLLVDHEEKFTNHFYHSVLDEADNIGFVYRNISIDSNGTFIDTSALLDNGTMKESDLQVKVARLATAFARTLYQRVASTSYVGNLTASAHLVDEMLYCFLESQACRLLRAADYASSSSGDEVPAKPASLYVSVASWPGSGAVFAGHLLALLTGQHLPVNRTQCDALDTAGFSQYWLSGWNHTGVCVQTTMNFTQAVSPAFIIQDYDYTSGIYSTWTESVWQTMWARVFVAASGRGASVAAVCGIFTTIVSAVVTYWLQKHSSTVFANSTPSSTADAATGILRSVNC